jgi:hypothetical protein
VLDKPWFPLVLAVNVVGCFAIGLLGGLLGAWLNGRLEVFFGLMAVCLGGLMSRLI